MKNNKIRKFIISYLIIGLVLFGLTFVNNITRFQYYTIIGISVCAVLGAVVGRWSRRFIPKWSKK